MKRDIPALETRLFDAIVIGGGIYGAAVTWELTRSGYKVLLLEKGDFCGATSANSLKILHGGLRYLQHLDLKRMRESIFSRRELMRFCPHLVRPLGCLMPTSGFGLRSKGVMRAAFLLNDLISWDRNKGLTRANRLPAGRLLSRKSFAAVLPGLSRKEVTGGALWYDGLAVNTERLALEYILGSCDLGAWAVNYFQVNRIVTERGRVRGVEGTDLLSGRSCRIDTGWVINTAGPWFELLLRDSGIAFPDRTSWAKAVNLVVTKQLHPEFGIGLESREEYHDQDAMFRRGKRLYFFVPWRQGTMIGTTYRLYVEHPDQLRVTRDDIDEIVSEVNQIYPRMNLQHEDVSFFHCGLVPMANDPDPEAADVQLAKHSLVLEHGRLGGPEGLISLRSIKYTTAPAVARQVAERIVRREGRKKTSLPSGRRISRTIMAGKEVAAHLERKYGSRADRVLAVAASLEEPEAWLHRQPDVMAAEIHYLVREEMAVTLADVVFRRTDLGTFGCPPRPLLEGIAEIMATELAWNPERIRSEVAQVERVYEPWAGEGDVRLGVKTDDR